MTEWLPVRVPVEVQVGPVQCERWDAREVFIPPDDGYVIAPAVGAWCRLTFRFDGRWVRSKTVKAKVRMGEEPTEAQWLAAEAEARRQVEARIVAHGAGGSDD